jgi:hypothetical protein
MITIRLATLWVAFAWLFWASEGKFVVLLSLSKLVQESFKNFVVLLNSIS